MGNAERIPMRGAVMACRSFHPVAIPAATSRSSMASIPEDPAVPRVGIEDELAEGGQLAQPGTVGLHEQERVAHTELPGLLRTFRPTRTLSSGPSSLDIAEGQIQGVSAIVNPDKLRDLEPIGDARALLRERGWLLAGRRAGAGGSPHSHHEGDGQEGPGPPPAAPVEVSAELLGQSDDDALRATQEAEPVDVLVLRDLVEEFGTVAAQAGNDVVDVIDSEHDAAYAQRIRRRVFRLGSDRRRRVEPRQLNPAVAVRGPHHGVRGANAVEPDGLVHPRPLDRDLSFQLHTELGEERFGSLEVVDNDENVVHPLNRHSAELPALDLGGSRQA